MWNSRSSCRAMTRERCGCQSTPNFRAMPTPSWWMPMSSAIRRRWKKPRKIWNVLSNPRPRIFTINISNRRIRQISASCSCRLRGCTRRWCAEDFWRPCSATTRSILRVRPRWQHCSTACRWVSVRWRFRSAPARSGMCSVRSRQSSTSLAMCWKARRTASIKPTRSWIS